MGKRLQKVTFQPSPNQLKFAEIYLIWWEKKTMKDIAKEIGVTRKTIWKWFQNKDFAEWINEQAKQLLSQSLSNRIKVAIRKAITGDFQFAKLLFEMEGEYIPQQKTESEGLIKVIVEYVDKKSNRNRSP